MTRINLLPWREEYRQERKKEFIVQFVGVAILAVAVAFLWIQSVESKVQHQNARNNHLDAEIKKLAAQVDEIEKLKKKRKELLDRMQVIQDLEGKRSIIVHYFDAFAKSVPDGVFITKLDKKGDLLTIQGVSESNQRISVFMRQLNGSEWFTSPNLRSVVASDLMGEQSGEFVMEVKTSLPDKESNNG